MPTEQADRLDPRKLAADLAARIASTQSPRLLLTPREAATVCGFSLRTWWRLDSAGKIPAAVRFGRSKRWPAEVLRRWIEAGCPDRQRWETMQATG